MSTLAVLAVALVAGYALIRFSFRAARHTHQRGDHPNGRCWICGASMPQETPMQHTATDIHPPVHNLCDGRPYTLLEIEEWRTVDGELCFVGVWAWWGEQIIVTRALARAAVVMIPEAVAS